MRAIFLLLLIISLPQTALGEIGTVALQCTGTFTKWLPEKAEMAYSEAILIDFDQNKISGLFGGPHAITSADAATVEFINTTAKRQNSGKINRINGQLSFWIYSDPKQLFSSIEMGCVKTRKAF